MVFGAPECYDHRQTITKPKIYFKNVSDVLKPTSSVLRVMRWYFAPDFVRHLVSDYGVGF